MAASSIAAFWAVALLLIIVPGADWAFTISAGLRGRFVIAAVSGIVLGYTAMTIVVSAGVGAVVARSAALLTSLTVAGGVYLMWHGATTFARPSAPAAPAETPASTNRATLVRGVGVGGLNPKGLLIFLALLPQFANPHGSWPLAAQLAILGLVFTLTCAAFYLCLGSFARKILHARPAGRRTGPHPILRRRDDHHRRPPAHRSPHHLTSTSNPMARSRRLAMPIQPRSPKR